MSADKIIKTRRSLAIETLVDLYVSSINSNLLDSQESLITSGVGFRSVDNTDSPRPTRSYNNGSQSLAPLVYRDSVRTPFPTHLFLLLMRRCLWACLLQRGQSCLDGVYQLRPQLFSAQLLLFETGKLFRECVVAEHLDPVLEVASSKVELERCDVDGVDYSQKVG